MKRYALCLILALLMHKAALAQTINCDSSTHYDQNGNVCTNFTITPGQADGGTGTTFLINSQDGTPSSVYPDFTPGISIGYFAGWGQMFDPLKVLGLVSDGSLGNECLLFGTEYCTTDTNGYNLSENVIAHGGTGSSQWFERQYSMTNFTVQPQSLYPYVWNGTLNITFRCFKYTCRYGKCSCSFATGSQPGDSLGVMEATHL